MNTPSPLRVITQTEATPAGIVAGDAHELAGITYRQLDHWARQGWVTPSIDPGTGRSGRRLYSVDDVIRLGVLRHLAMSKVNTAIAGPAVAQLEVPDGDVRVVWGPVGNGDASFQILYAAYTLDAIESGGAWIVFDPDRIRESARNLLGVQEEPASIATISEATI